MGTPIPSSSSDTSDSETVPSLVSDSGEDEFVTNPTPVCPIYRVAPPVEIGYPPFRSNSHITMCDPPKHMIPYWLIHQANPISYPRCEADGSYFWNIHWNSYFAEQHVPRTPAIWGYVPQDREIPIEQPLEHWFMGTNRTYWVPEQYADCVVEVGKHFDAAVLHSRDYDPLIEYQYHYNRYTFALTQPTDDRNPNKDRDIGICRSTLGSKGKLKKLPRSNHYFPAILVGEGIKTTFREMARGWSGELTHKSLEEIRNRHLDLL